MDDTICYRKSETICFNKNLFFISIAILIAVLCYYSYLGNQQLSSNQAQEPVRERVIIYQSSPEESSKKVKSQSNKTKRNRNRNNHSIIEEEEIEEGIVGPGQPGYITPPSLVDHDYHKYTHPLASPRRRSSTYEIPYAPETRLALNIRTQGEPDTFHQMGYIQEVNGGHDKHDKHDRHDNKKNTILPLFGRKCHYRSDKYEYYTSFNNDSNSVDIKIPINSCTQYEGPNRKLKELYTGDEVTLPGFDNKFRVNLYEHDALRYYPDVFA